jgi:hypothetical protein
MKKNISHCCVTHKAQKMHYEQHIINDFILVLIRRFLWVGTQHPSQRLSTAGWSEELQNIIICIWQYADQRLLLAKQTLSTSTALLGGGSIRVPVLLLVLLSLEFDYYYDWEQHNYLIFDNQPDQILLLFFGLWQANIIIMNLTISWSEIDIIIWPWLGGKQTNTLPTSFGDPATLEICRDLCSND